MMLNALESTQTTSSAFKITDLAYYSSFNSFLINCISVPAATSTPECYNWTYAVNGSYPRFSAFLHAPTSTFTRSVDTCDVNGVNDGSEEQ